MSEAAIQKKMIDYLNNQGAYVFKVISANKKGIPDICCCYKGLFIAIEVKRPASKRNVSKLQQYNIDSIKRAGGIALVAWDLEQIQLLIENLNLQS